MTSKAAEPDQDNAVPGEERRGDDAERSASQVWTRRVLGTTTGRFLVALILAGAVGSLLWLFPSEDNGFREWSLDYFAWSAIPLGTWFLGFLYMLMGKWSLMAARWRETLASLAFAFAAVGVMSLLDNPSATPFAPHDPLGGRISTYVTFAPSDAPFSLGFWDYVLGGIRIGGVVLVGVAIASPRRSAKATIVASIWTTVGLGMMWKGTRNGAGGVRRWRAARAETKRLREEDRLAYEESVTTSEPAARPSPFAEALQRVADEPEPPPYLGSAFDEEREARREPVGEVDRTEEVTPPWEESDEEISARVQAVSMAPESGAATDSEVVQYPRPTFNWKLPSADKLRVAPEGGVTQSEIQETSRLIEDSLSQYGIQVTVDQVFTGPTVTMYGLKPGWKGKGDEPTAGGRVRVDAILNREKDLALALASPSLRFEPVVPGESVVGIEVPNSRPTPVTLRSVMDTKKWQDFQKSAALPVPLGLGSGGDPVFADLARMPHTLVAGATGSGKSVCMNTIITGLLMCRSPYEVRMVMIDPKRVELTPYQGIPHLYTPVVVEADRAVVVLRSLVQEMMGRFRTLEQAGVKNITSFNEKSSTKMPYLLIMVDELADLMLSAANEVERLLVRLAQLGRATGVHLVVATQRPSVDVVTGLIKANFPSRISFAVMSQVDSRTVLDSVGGEKLLGRGDMLYLPIDMAKPQRVQGAFLSDTEIESIVDYWNGMNGPDLPQLEVKFDDEDGGGGDADLDDAGDSLFDKAAALAGTQKTLSTSLLQRRLRIGYPRAARLMDELEDAGIVGPGEPGKPRQVLG